MYKRRNAREQAVMIIFENMFNHESVSCIARMSENYRDIKIIPFGKKLAKHAIDNKAKIDEIIDRYLVKWSIDRISRLSLAILEMSVAELLFIDNVPQAVTINEAIEISKLYLQSGEIKFIHGVLGAVVENINDKSILI